MKTLKVGIASYEDTKARTMAIARGELRPKPGDPKVWFTSPESFAKLLSNRNRALLARIADTHPASLSELAAASGRSPGNLMRTLKTMARYALVRLHKGERGKLRPEVPYREVCLEMSLSWAARLRGGNLTVRRAGSCRPAWRGWAGRSRSARSPRSARSLR